MLREFFLNEVTQAVKSAAKKGMLGQMTGSEDFSLIPEIPKNSDFGDFAVNISSLSKYTKLPPNKTAEIAAAEITAEDYDINTAAGFINFKLKPAVLNSIIAEVLDKQLDYGRNNIGAGECGRSE